MSSVFAAAESLLVDRIVSNQLPVMGRSKIGLGLYALAGLSLVCGFLFLIYAAYLWLSTNFSPEVASAYVGLMAIGVSFLCILSSFAFLKMRRRRMRQVRAELADTIFQTLEVVDEELSRPICENPKTAVLVSSLAGFIVGEKWV